MDTQAGVDNTRARQNGGLVDAFVSYRTKDAAAIAAELSERLKRDLGLANVYYARTGNEPGSRWPDVVESRLHGSNLVVAIIGPSWPNCTAEDCGEENPEATDCIHDPEDWVRREVTYALHDSSTSFLPIHLGTEVVEVVRHGLPPALAEVKNRQGVVLDESGLTDRRYHEVLTFAWTSLRTRMDHTLIVISDDTDQAEVEIDKLVEVLDADGLVDLDRFTASINDPRGLRAIPLRDAADRWSDIVTIVPRTPSEVLRARLAAASRVRGVREVACLGAGAGLATSGVLQEAVGGAAKLVTVDGPSALIETAKGGWWQSLTTTGKVALAGGSAAVLAAGALLVLPGPAPRATAFTYAGMEYTTGEVTLDPLPWGADTAEPDPDPEVDHLLLPMRIANVDGITTEGLRFHQMPVAETWNLAFGDGTEVAAEGLIRDDQAWLNTTWGLIGVDALDRAISFPVKPGQDLTDAVLTMRINEMAPLDVPLDGAFEPTVVEVDIEASWTGDYDGDIVRLVVDGARASVDNLRDPETGDLYPAFDYDLKQRADDGFVWLYLLVSAEVVERPYPTIPGRVQPPQAIAGQATYPGLATYVNPVDDFTTIIEAGSPQEFIAIVPVPVDAQAIQVQFSYGEDPFVVEVDPSFIDAFS